MNADRERALDRFVNREVYACVSGLVFDVTRLATDTKLYYDLLESNLLGGYMECPCVPGEDYWQRQNRQIYADGYAKDHRGEVEPDCENCGGDGEILREPFEHWIVSSWLAERLAERGALVGEWCDLHIWGRETTEQAIILDGIISEIYDSIQVIHNEGAVTIYAESE